jgi:predicted protein tyrosine phosphatase
MKPIHTKFISRAEAELYSSICLATIADSQEAWIDGLISLGSTYSPSIEAKQTALISVNSPNGNDPKEAVLRQDDGPPKVTGFWEPLMLQFNDIDPAGCGEEFLSKFILFDEEHANQILDYLIRVETADDVFQVWAHCQAGVSRSAGIAKFIAGLYNIYFPQDYRYENVHVYKTLLGVYNHRILTNKPCPGKTNELIRTP